MSPNQILVLSGYITDIVSFLVLLYGLTRRKYWNFPIKIYWFFLLTAFLLDLFSIGFIWGTGKYTSFFLPFLNYFHINNTNFLRIFRHLNNFICLGWFYSLIIPNKKISRGIIIISGILVLAALINYLFIEGHNVAGGFNSTVSTLYCVLVPLFFMVVLFNQDSELPILKNSYFWINLGLILPCSISLFLRFSGDVIYKTDFPLYVNLSVARNYIEIIAQIITAIGFYYTNKLKFIKL